MFSRQLNHSTLIHFMQRCSHFKRFILLIRRLTCYLLKRDSGHFIPFKALRIPTCLRTSLRHSCELPSARAGLGNARCHFCQVPFLPSLWTGVTCSYPPPPESKQMAQFSFRTPILGILHTLSSILQSTSRTKKPTCCCPESRA